MESYSVQQESDIRRIRLRWITRTALLLAITLALQMLGLPQPFTGPAINAMLLISGILVGATGGILIGLLTPWIAFVRGILAAPLGPMIPFIMLGNAVLVAAFCVFRRLWGNGLRGSVPGLLIGSILKYLILASAVSFAVKVPPAVAKAMQVPQLITALTGGIVVLIIEKAVTRALSARNARSST